MNSCWRWWKCPMKFNGSGLSQPPADGQDGRPHREIVQVQPLRLTWGKRLKTHGETHRETMGFNPSENHRDIWRFNHSYSLVICYIAIENTPFSSLIYLFKMVIFHSYVKVYQRVNLHDMLVLKSVHWYTCEYSGIYICYIWHNKVVQYKILLRL